MGTSVAAIQAHIPPCYGDTIAHFEFLVKVLGEVDVLKNLVHKGRGIGALQRILPQQLVAQRAVTVGT